ncbi:hypothetical protein DFA_06638 [Cavenderia fasciculata]|uniref:Cobalamin adenosyltransferase-like domain-containing protein n=1 Tax=Cavenderia fasciculata TaxID=261658 RepID=F4Q1V2_CACFS|nr:uncharacterized protein DFA_06638 [Cavenderia fasciculata]EGG17972.1 hypothetical protein DFA_06638 [Cavenderia fasciculata]|eukprot:XP_004356864.1 hypothetical protein DFA_06638 [Cavenderia fasciculata]
MAVEYCKLKKNKRLIEKIPELEEIQCLLFDLGSHIATPRTEGSSSSMHLARTEFSETHVEKIELAIDEMDKYLAPLKNFILPGGGLESSQFHICRAVCRRTERDMSPLLRESAIDETAPKFINRLSDYFFAVSRYCSLVTNHPESVYKLPKDRDSNNKYQRSGLSVMKEYDDDDQHQISISAA